MQKKIIWIGILLLVVGVIAYSCSFAVVPFSLDEPFLMPTSSYLLTESFSIRPSNHTSVNKTLSNGDFLHISVEVSSSGDPSIDFYVMDESSYLNWENDEAASPQISRTRTSTFDIDWAVPYSGTWHFVFDNSFSSTASKDVTTNITKHWTETLYRQVTRYEPLISPYVGAVILLGGALVLIVGKAVKAPASRHRRRH